MATSDGKDRRGSAGPRKPNGRACWKRKDVRYNARTIVIGDDVWERIGVESVRRGMDRSAVADALLYGSMKGYVISDRRGAGPEQPAANPGDEAGDPGQVPAIGETLSPPGGESAAEGPGQGRGAGGGKKRSA